MNEMAVAEGYKKVLKFQTSDFKIYMQCKHLKNKNTKWLDTGSANYVSTQFRIKKTALKCKDTYNCDFIC